MQRTILEYHRNSKNKNYQALSRLTPFIINMYKMIDYFHFDTFEHRLVTTDTSI